MKRDADLEENKRVQQKIRLNDGDNSTQKIHVCPEQLEYAGKQLNQCSRPVDALDCGRITQCS